MKNARNIQPSRPSSKSLYAFAVVAAVALSVVSARAATVYYAPAAGDDYRNWDDPDVWSDGNAASAGNDYIVDPTHAGDAGTQLLTDETDLDSSFPGDFLTLQNGGELVTRSDLSGDADRTITISNLVVNNGSIAHAWKQATHTLAGNLDVGAGGMTVWNNRDNRTFIFDFLMSGSGAIAVHMANDLANDPTGGALTLNNSSSIWDGDLTLVKESNADAGAFAVSCALDNSGSHLTGDGGDWDLLSYTHRFGSADIGGTSLAPGTYDAIALNTYGGTSFSGSGAIEIIPEPSALVLLCFGCLVLFCRRSRRSA